MGTPFLPTPQGMPQTYLIPAILVTLFCCLPSGIASIVFAAQVSSKYNSGDVAGAMAASSKARTWVIVSIVAGVVVGVIYVIALAASNSSSA
jgi:predicted secreted protein